MAGRIIALTGLPGSDIGKVSKHLEMQGMQLLWPGQDIKAKEARAAYQRGENIELNYIHDSIFAQTGKDWFTRRAPRYYDVPYPGPKEYLAQFNDQVDIVLADFRLIPFLPIWNNYVDHLFVCDVPPEWSAKVMFHWHKEQAALDLCSEVAQHYRQRMQETITAAMDRHTRLPHACILNGQFAGIVQKVLESVF